MALTDVSKKTLTADFGKPGATALLFAALVSANALFVIVYGLFGLPGNSITTGGFLTVTELAILALSFRQDESTTLADAAFLALIVCIAFSAAVNQNVAPAKNWIQLLLSLFAFWSCRFVRGKDLEIIRSGFVWVTVPIITIGTVATVAALITQWNDPHGKPYVLGFDAAATSFLGVLGFFVVASITTRLEPKRAMLLSAFLFFPAMTFAASQVRFTFAALIGSMALAAILSGGRQRWLILAIAVAIMIGAATGLYVRSHTTVTFLRYVVEQNIEKREQVAIERSSVAKNVAPAINPPSCRLEINKDNSIAIRKALLADSIYLAGLSGFFGFGLDSFVTYSCIQATEAHNSFLQVVIEFGWIAGFTLLALLILVGLPLAKAARADSSARLLLCWLFYSAALSLAHGRINQEIALFAILGLAAPFATATIHGRPSLSRRSGDVRAQRAI